MAAEQKSFVIQAVKFSNSASALKGYGHTEEIRRPMLSPEDTKLASMGMRFFTADVGRMSIPDGFNTIAENLDPLEPNNGGLNNYCYGVNAYNSEGSTPTRSLHLVG